LKASREGEISNVGKSNYCGHCLPVLPFGLGCNYARPEKLLDAGASVHIASDLG